MYHRHKEPPAIFAFCTPPLFVVCGVWGFPNEEGFKIKNSNEVDRLNFESLLRP